MIFATAALQTADWTGPSTGGKNTRLGQYFTQIKYDKIKYLARKSHKWQLVD